MLTTNATTARLADRAALRISGLEASVDMRDLAGTVSPQLAALNGGSVLISTTTQLAAASALIHLDGLVRRMTIAPPDLKPDQLAAIVEDAEIEAVVTDSASSDFGRPRVVGYDPQVERGVPAARAHETEWVMLTSGTSGRPKLVAHTLAALCGAIGAAGARGTVWSTFYDIRRYGGLQIFLRAVLGGADLVLSSDGEDVAAALDRLGAAGVTAVSGTPSHWRRVLMSPSRGRFSPRYVRLSGETADQVVLDSLRAAFPDAAIGHAYASTEAGVAFAVDDGLAGFPAGLVDTPGPVGLTVVEGTLRIRSSRTATRYLGTLASALRDADGYVDTGDLVERRGERYYFAGRRNGIINVGGAKVNPEEVEAVINGHSDVRMSLAKAKRNPLLGAIVVADVVLRDGATADSALEHAILDRCRATLERHKVPAMLRFVPNLPLTPAGKLSRVASADA